MSSLRNNNERRPSDADRSFLPEIASPFWTAMLDELRDGVVFLDTELGVTLWSASAERLTGLTASRVEGKSFIETISSLIPPDESQHLESAIRGHAAQTVPLLLTLTPDIVNAAKISIDCRISPIHGAVLGAVLGAESGSGSSEQPDFLGAVLLLQDASSRLLWERERRVLREETRRDPLTGVANRTEFERAHGELFDTHRQRNTSYALIVCDIDRFKRINDTHGHQVGDDVILALTDVLREASGDGDLVARYGGEEFVMLYSDCTLSEAAARAETMREAFSRRQYVRLEGLAVTVSFGVAELRDDDTVESLFHRADRRLLHAKNEGRNRVVANTGREEGE